MNIANVFESLKILLNKEQDQVITPLILGKPGIGKSDLIKQIKEHFNFDCLIDLRLSQHDNVDIKGAPKEDKNDLLKWLSPNFMPVEGNSYFEGKTGILFFDELNRGRPDTIQSVFEIIYDRTIGGRKILDGWKIVCAGNLGYEDDCDVYELDAAFMNRIVKLQIDHIRIDDWMKWAKDNNIHKAIISFLTKNPKYFDYEGNDGDDKFSVRPRSWGKFSEILQQNLGNEKEITSLFGHGIIYSAQAQFLEHLRMVSKIDPADVFKRYDQIIENLDSIERTDIYELNEKLIDYIVKHKNKITKKQKENFNKYLDNYLNDDNKIAFCKDAISKGCLEFLQKDISLDYDLGSIIWNTL